MDADPFDGDRDQPLFIAVGSDDPQLVRCKVEAQQTLDLFCELFEKHKADLGVYFAFKVPIVDGDDIAHLWYSFTGRAGNFIAGEHFQLPPELADRKSVQVHFEDVEDWMINDHGVLYGGFTLRYQRSLLPDRQQESFDRYTGIRRYAELD